MIKTLKTRAVCTVKDRPIKGDHAVILSQSVSHREDFKDKWVLSIEDTPAVWYLSSLLKDDQKGPDIFIDLGQKWRCTNFDKIMKEAISLI